MQSAWVRRRPQAGPVQGPTTTRRRGAVEREECLIDPNALAMKTVIRALASTSKMVRSSLRRRATNIRSLGHIENYQVIRQDLTTTRESTMIKGRVLRPRSAATPFLRLGALTSPKTRQRKCSPGWAPTKPSMPTESQPFSRMRPVSQFQLMVHIQSKQCLARLTSLGRKGRTKRV